MEEVNASAAVLEVKVVERAARVEFSVEYKRRILKEADACSQEGGLGALLRREGLYCSHLSVWRAARERGEIAGLAPRKGGPKVASADPRDRKIVELERGARGWQARAERAEVLVELRKSSALLGITLPESAETP